MKLSGDRNQCQGCKEFFNSTAAFDKHRTGAFGVDRRCRTVDEMTAASMAKNAAEFWITAPNPMNFPMHGQDHRPHGWELIG
jgi:hypothetical protein